MSAKMRDIPRIKSIGSGVLEELYDSHNPEVVTNKTIEYRFRAAIPRKAGRNGCEAALCARFDHATGEGNEKSHLCNHVMHPIWMPTPKTQMS